MAAPALIGPGSTIIPLGSIVTSSVRGSKKTMENFYNLNAEQVISTRLWNEVNKFRKSPDSYLAILPADISCNIVSSYIIGFNNITLDLALHKEVKTFKAKTLDVIGIIFVISSFFLAFISYKFAGVSLAVGLTFCALGNRLNKETVFEDPNLPQIQKNNSRRLLSYLERELGRVNGEMDSLYKANFIDFKVDPANNTELQTRLSLLKTHFIKNENTTKFILSLQSKKGLLLNKTVLKLENLLKFTLKSGYILNVADVLMPRYTNPLQLRSVNNDFKICYDALTKASLDITEELKVIDSELAT